MTSMVPPSRPVAQKHVMLTAPARQGSISSPVSFNSVLQNQRQVSTRGERNRGSASLSRLQGEIASSRTNPGRAERAKPSNEARRTAKADGKPDESVRRSSSPTDEASEGRRVSNTTEANDDGETDTGLVSREQENLDSDTEDSSGIHQDETTTKPHTGSAPAEMDPNALGDEAISRVVPTHDLMSSQASTTDLQQQAMGIGASENGDVGEESVTLLPHAAGKASMVAGSSASNAQFSPSLHDSSAAPANAPQPAAGPLQSAAHLASLESSGATTVAPASVAAMMKSDGAMPAAQIMPPDLSQLRDDANVGRVVRGLGTAIHQRGGSLTLRLDPPELGAVRIELNVRDGVVQARFVTQQESVRNLLMDQMGHLRQAFDRQGLTVERIEVQAMPQAHDGRFSSNDPDDGRGAKYQGSRQQGESRGGKNEGEAGGRFESAFLESTKG